MEPKSGDDCIQVPRHFVALDHTHRKGRNSCPPTLAMPATLFAKDVDIRTSTSYECKEMQLKTKFYKEDFVLEPSSSPCTVRDKYRFGEVLGSGSFSTVRVVTDKETGKKWACKILRMQRLNCMPGRGESSVAEITSEILVLKALGTHRSNIHLREYFVESDNVYIIMEMVTGGELLYAVADRGSLPEEDTRDIMQTVLEGLDHMHSRNIAHRDLKLENLLLIDSDRINNVKIADFGLSKILKNNYQKMNTVCGTPMYVSPEALDVLDKKIYKEGYGLECDVWAAGIIMYILLGGHPPFTDKHGRTEAGASLFRSIQKGAFTFNDPVWELVSDAAKDLISKLLVVEPEARITAKSALMHPFLRGRRSKQSRHSI